MSRHYYLNTVILMCVIATQAWLIYRVETVMSVSEGNASREMNMKTGYMPDAELKKKQQTVLLAQISSRLASLEAARSREASSVLSTSATIVSGTAEAVAADRKLLAMLPKEPMTQEELMLFQAQFGQFPAAEQHQLSAALARAINSGRIQPKNH